MTSLGRAAFLQRTAASSRPGTICGDDFVTLQRVIGNRAVARMLSKEPSRAPAPHVGGRAGGRIQRLQVTKENRKKVEVLRQRYVKAKGNETGWNAVLRNAKDLSALTAHVENLEAPKKEGPGEKEANIDRHGGKHLRGRKKPTSEREMKAKSKTQPATFFPSVDYNRLLRQVVPVAEKAGSTFVEVGKDVGVDKGEITSIVELYGSSDIGYHIRPKSATYIKNFKSRGIPSLVAPESSGGGLPGETLSALSPSSSSTSPSKTEFGGKKVGNVVPDRIEGVGRVEDVSGRGMNCLIRAIYASIGVAIDDKLVNTIRQHLQQQGVAHAENMLNLVGAAGAVLIAFLVGQNVIPANRGIVVYTPNHLNNPIVVINGVNPINLWLSDDHFRAIVPGG